MPLKLKKSSIISLNDTFSMILTTGGFTGKDYGNITGFCYIG